MLYLLKGPSYSIHSKPKKLVIMLHGYGDNAENFIHLAKAIDQKSWGAHYIALNAPEIIPNYPMGYQWFTLYPNNVYIEDAGPSEVEIVNQSIINSVKKIELTIDYHLRKLGLKMNDCFLLGFSQGGMMAFEFGNNISNSLGGIIILSGQILKQDNKNSKTFKDTPIYISHGSKDEVLPIKKFYESIKYLKNNNFNFESHELNEDTHTISQNAIHLLQKFIKKNL